MIDLKDDIRSKEKGRFATIQFDAAQLQHDITVSTCSEQDTEQFLANASRELDVKRGIVRALNQGNLLKVETKLIPF